MANQTLRLTQKVLGHMDSMASGNHKGGMLLTGDPGVGKTTYANMLGSLLGMKVVTIEVPHITEEHLINIPFIVYNPISNSSQTMNSQVTQDYKMVLAQSNLFAQISSAPHMNDQMYLHHVKQSPAPVQQLFRALGGTDAEIPQSIQEARKTHSVILFLDEYYRQTTPRIRNIMRGILNNKIGMHQIPNNVYVLYASNMKDSGLEEIHSNAQFTAVKFKTPSKEDWFGWLVSKFQQDQSVKLDMKIINKFKQLLDDEDLSHTDIESEVRTSPRRWEQILLYINSSLPVENQEEARTLMTNIHNSFIHYQSKQTSSLATKVTKAVSELISETSGININAGERNQPHDWRSSLQHLVEQQMKLGDHLKYIPVVSGQPGIGKTENAMAVAAKFNLRLIDIDVSELNADDVIGMPLPGNREGEKLDVNFSVPKLYQQINTQIEEQTKAYYTMLKQKHGDDADQYIEHYEDQKWKYLIFFDEINRTDEKTFNALRRVILEKNFGPSGDGSGELLKLPKGSIVIAAMNPEGHGTQEMTHHFRDVINVIPAQASWAATKKYLMNKQYKGVDDTIKDASMNILQAFVDKFKSDDSQYTSHTAPFHLDVGSELYISPREYTDMFSTLVRELNHAIKEAFKDDDLNADEIREMVTDAVADALEDSLNFIFHKHNIDPDEFEQQLRQWVKNLDDHTFGGVLTKKAKNINDLSSTMSKYLDGKDVLGMVDDIDIINGNNAVNNAQFINDVRELFADKITDEESVRKYIIEKGQKKVEVENDTLKHGTEKVSLVENFTLALLFTLHVHQYQNDRLMVVGKALNTAVSDVLKSLASKIDAELKMEAQIEVAQLRGDIHSMIETLN